MKTINRLASIAVTLTLLGIATIAAPKTERLHKHFTVTGTVLQRDNKDRTLLVEDLFSKKLYLIAVPDGATFKITFGRYMRMAAPGFEDVRTGERVQVRCTRNSSEHLALSDGKSVTPLVAAR